MKANKLNTLANTLKNCPFCNNKATLEPMPNQKNWWRVRCINVHCGGTNWAQQEPELATEIWNKRNA